MNHRDVMDLISKEYNQRSEFCKQFDDTCRTRDKLKCIQILIDKFGCDFDSARIVIDYFIDRVPMPVELSPQKKAELEAEKRAEANKPKCITCGSTNIRKMGTVERGASIVTFGVFSKKINKTFKCNNCGMTW